SPAPGAAVPAAGRSRPRRAPGAATPRRARTAASRRSRTFRRGPCPSALLPRAAPSRAADASLPRNSGYNNCGRRGACIAAAAGGWAMTSAGNSPPPTCLVGVTRDARNADGSTFFDPMAFRVLDEHRAIKWEYLGEETIGPASLQRFDVICVAAPGITVPAVQ